MLRWTVVWGVEDGVVKEGIGRLQFHRVCFGLTHDIAEIRLWLVPA